MIYRFVRCLLYSMIFAGAAIVLDSATILPEILLLHFAGRADNRLTLEGGMISPGKYRTPAAPENHPALRLEMIDMYHSVLWAGEFIDPRQCFPAPSAGYGNRLPGAGDVTPFSLRVPWNRQAAQLRVTDQSGKLLLLAALDRGFEENARHRFQAVCQEIEAQAVKVRRFTEAQPARVSVKEVPADFDTMTEPRFASADQLMSVRDYLQQLPKSGITESVDRAEAATVIFRVTDIGGQPVAKAGIVAIDKISGKISGGALTDAEGRASVSVAEGAARVYVFPPYIASTAAPVYARRILEPGITGPSSLDVTLEPGVLVSGRIQTVSGVSRSSFSITAVDARSNESFEYARSNSTGSYAMRLPEGRYRFYVGPRPGAGLLVTGETQISGPNQSLDFSTGQGELYLLSGRVIGSGGESIAGARVSVLDAAGNAVFSATTSSDGIYNSSTPADGFLFVYPNSSTRYQAVTLSAQQAMQQADIKLPELTPIKTVDALRPQLGLVYGDASDPTRLNMVFIGDGYTEIDEPFTDSNGNGAWDGDVYLDENGNGQYDSGETYFNRNGTAGYQAGEPFEDLNGDGVRSANEQALLDRNVLDYVRVLLGTSPWPDMLSRINFWRVRTVSQQTAGDFQEFGISRDTVLNTRYGVKSTGYIISVDNARMVEMVQALIPEFDHIISISNSALGVGRANASYNGNLRLKGGDFDNLSTVATHELGHAVGLLGDEYSDSTIIDTNYAYKGSEPTQANVTTVPFPMLTKWALELDGSLPYPTPADLPGVGLFEGGSYSYRGVYRPEYSCMMRSNTPRFCVVCNREMRAQIIERSSAAALNYPILISDAGAGMPQGLRTSFAAVNTDPLRTAEAAFVAYNENGKLHTGRGVLNPSAQLLEPGRQLAILDQQLFGFAAPLNGWVRASSTASIGGFYLVSDEAFSEKIDGGVANPEAGSDLALPYVRRDAGAQFLYSIANPTTRSAPFTVYYYRSSGSTLSTISSRTLLAKGQVMQIAPAGTAWIQIRSTANPPVQLIAAGMDYDTKTLSMQPAQALNGAPGVLTLPHYAVGGGYETRLVAVSANATALTLVARRHDGTVVGSIQRDLTRWQQLDVSVADLFNLLPSEEVQVGYITIDDVPAGPGVQSIAALAYFRYRDESSAVCTALRAPQTSLLFSHVANETPAGGSKTFLTGLTLINPNDNDASFSVSVYDKQGARIAHRSMTLAAHGKISRMLSGDPVTSAFFASPMSAASGYIVVLSDRPLFGLELFFSSDLSLLAAVPAQ